MTALVTGGAQRIGKVLALRLGELGASVAVHYKGSGAQAYGVCSQLQAKGVKAVALQADLADPQACRALEKPLSTLESQAYFETLPAPVRARVLFARALCEAMAVFLEAESPARVAERCRGDLTRAFTLDPQVDASWRQSGRLSPRIEKVFDEARR